MPRSVQSTRWEGKATPSPCSHLCPENEVAGGEVVGALGAGADADAVGEASAAFDAEGRVAWLAAAWALEDEFDEEVFGGEAAGVEADEDLDFFTDLELFEIGDAALFSDGPAIVAVEALAPPAVQDAEVEATIQRNLHAAGARGFERARRRDLL